MTAALSISNLRKRYKGEIEALAGIDLEIPAGAFFGLLGRNGAGKSTLIGLIAGLVRMQTGQIRVFGYDNQRQAMAARQCIGLVPQEVNFNSFEPVFEIVATQGMYYGLSRRHAQRRAHEMLEQLGLTAKAKKKAWGLSGGMKRRLMIARALVHQPRLLILDEPSAGLDVEARQDTWTMLQGLNRDGISVLLTTHYLEEAEALCDDLAVIEAGQIIARDRPQTLLAGLRSQHLILDLASALQAPPTLAPGHVRSWTAHQLEVDWPSEAGLDALFAQLAQQGVQVSAMNNGSNRLEARFLELLASRTGREQT
jgi:ABC-2 type transport system ATP-binding protein